MKKMQRLKKNSDFQKVFKNGRSMANRQFVVYQYKHYRDNHSQYFRVGLSVSKKIGNAVTRNRIKRYIKDVIHRLDNRLPAGYDLIIIARKPTHEMDYHQVKSSLNHVLKRAKLLKSDKGG